MTSEHIPPILYKFRKWDRDSNPPGFECRILTHREAYFTSPKYFNDPFDCKIGLDLASKTKGDYVNHFSKEYSTEKVTALSEALTHNPEGFINDVAAMTARLADKSGVFCLSENPQDLLLWSHYSDGHQGFCIGIDSAAFPAPDVYLRRGSTEIHYVGVKYEDVLPSLDPFLEDPNEWLDQQYRYKAAVWNYEHEHRYVMIKDPQEGPLTDQERAFHLSPSAIKEIILGCKTDDDRASKVKTEVRRLAALNPNVRLLRSVKSKSRFSVDIVPEPMQ
ncbi:MAG: DUF2971 domain-containing protein [candidate division Zixibacteria bacterium]|nr:DUF2971 domain-containing protein [candidate division Zixibacteria bacterium]